MTDSLALLASPMRRSRAALLLAVAALATASCAGARTRVLTDKNRPPPEVDAAPAVLRALTVAVAKASDCSEKCTSDRAVCLPKNAEDTFVSDLRAAFEKAGYRVETAQGARGDLRLEACVRPTSAEEKTELWRDTGRSAQDTWDPSGGEFGKDPDGFLYEVGTTQCPTANRKIVIGRQKADGYDGPAAAAEIVNRLTACETLLAQARSKAGAPADSTIALTPAAPPPSASSSATPPATPDTSGAEDVVTLTDGTIVRGMITKEEPGKVVVVQHADGRSESIAWGAVAKITHRPVEDVVHLKDGTTARGIVVKEEPGQVVVLKRSDGRTDTFPWDAVVRVVRGKKSQ